MVDEAATTPGGKPFHTNLSVLFMTSSLVTSCLFSYSVGNWSKNFLQNEFAGFQQNTQVPNDNMGIITTAATASVLAADKKAEDLPVPLAKDGKVIPHTIYTSKNFDTRRSAYNSQWLQRDQDQSSNGSSPENEDEIPTPQNKRLAFEHNESSIPGLLQPEREDHDEEEEHLPAGQHLLVDINGIDGTFLDSQRELATAMITLVDNSGLTLLSYHCHGLSPEGVSCAGVLLESHVSFHTWPTEGVITLDLFTCGSTSLLNSLDLIENLFAIPRKDEEPPRMMWAYKRRGFKDQSSLSGQRDTFAYPLGIHGLEVKREIASTETSSGKDARIYDIEDAYQDPLRGILETSKAATSNRLLYLDGVLKAAKLWEVPAYESLVHPSMLVHQQPKKVLVVGGGIGASIRETLKHSSVEQVLVVGADETLVELSKEHLKGWNDCSDLVGSTTTSCFDDPRVELVYQNPMSWLSKSRDIMESVYDVVIVDYFDLDEEDSAVLTENNISFFSGLKSLLKEDGVVVLHVQDNVRSVDSVSPKIRNNGGGQMIEQRQMEITRALMTSGFESYTEYEESETGFIEASRKYVVGFKDNKSANRWTRNEAEVNAVIQKRIVPTKSGSPTLKFFDGATMTSYSLALASNGNPKMDVNIVGRGHINAAPSLPALLSIEEEKRKTTTAGNNANLSLEEVEVDAPECTASIAGKATSSIHETIQS